MGWIENKYILKTYGFAENFVVFYILQMFTCARAISFFFKYIFLRTDHLKEKKYFIYSVFTLT